MPIHPLFATLQFSPTCLELEVRGVDLADDDIGRGCAPSTCFLLLFTFTFVCDVVYAVTAFVAFYLDFHPLDAKLESKR